MTVWIWSSVAVQHKENLDAGFSKIHHTKSPEEQHSLNRCAPAETFKQEAGNSDSELRKLQENLLQSMIEKLL